MDRCEVRNLRIYLLNCATALYLTLLFNAVCATLWRGRCGLDAYIYNVPKVYTACTSNI